MRNARVHRVSPPDADDARRGRPAVHDEDSQGGLPKAKLDRQHHCMIDDGWRHIEGGVYRKEIASADRFPNIPVEGMIRRITREANSKKLLEDLRLARAQVCSAVGTSKAPDSRINRSMREPRDIDVEVELMSIDNSTSNPLEEPLPPKEASLYRAIVARVNFLAADRSELQFASKECSRRMANPRVMDWGAIKRI